MDSRRVFTWRENGAHCPPCYVTNIDILGDKRTLVCGNIMLGSCTSLYIFDAGTVNAQLYRDEILEAYVEAIPERDEILNVIEEVADFARQINLELDNDDVQELPDSNNQERTVDELIVMHEKYIEELESLDQTVTAGSDVVQSGCPIFGDFFQHLWPYIDNNTANVVFQMVKRLWLIRIDQ
ncbi:hypothetical protein TNCV_282951 [Trichonephila clavipes]|nr:hypothetical protein TNCV_282951 [Trichonephila clavipes]